MFAFLTDLYLEYFAGACTAGAGPLSVIVAMAGFSCYFFDFVRRLRNIVPHTQSAFPALIRMVYFSTYTIYRGTRRGRYVFVGKGGGGGQNVSKVGESGESEWTTGKFNVLMSGPSKAERAAAAVLAYAGSPMGSALKKLAERGNLAGLVVGGADLGGKGSGMDQVWSLFKVHTL